MHTILPATNILCRHTHYSFSLPCLSPVELDWTRVVTLLPLITTTYYYYLLLLSALLCVWISDPALDGYCLVVLGLLNHCLAVCICILFFFLTFYCLFWLAGGETFSPVFHLYIFTILTALLRYKKWSKRGWEFEIENIEYWILKYKINLKCNNQS